MRFLALVSCLIICLSFPSLLHAKEGARTASTPVIGDYHIFLDDPLPQPYINPVRPRDTHKGAIKNNTKLTALKISDNTMSSCLESLPYDYQSVMGNIAQGARVMANNTANDIEAFSFQPHFSGLMGPKITLMRKDLERAHIQDQGSANEIYHNAQIKPSMRVACDKHIRNQWDIELKHDIDAWDSDESPLIRSSIIFNDRYHFGGYFVGTLSARYMLYNNLDKEGDLRYLNTVTPTRQDYLGYAWQGTNIDRLMISTFATPTENLYVGLHGGYLEEMFFGVGGEC